MAESDQVRRLIADARNKGEGLLYSSEKAMAEFGALLPEDEREFMIAELAECRAQMETEDLAMVQEAVERLEVSAQRIGEAIYAAADQGQGGAPPSGGEA
jgi:molecular chaperone DnaK